LFDHIHPQAVHYLVAPGLRAISDVPGLTLEQKNARAAEVWAVMSSVDPYDAYSLMLYGQAFVLNDLCGDAARDALVEAKSGMMGGTESPMKWRAMSAYASLARTFCQNTNTFLKVRKEMAPPPPRSGGPRGKPKQPATEPAANAPPDAENGSATDRDPAAASAHPAAASFVVKPGAADSVRSDNQIVTQHKKNIAPDAARQAPEAAGEARACAGMLTEEAHGIARAEREVASEARVRAAMPTEAPARASLAPVAVPPATPLLAPLIAPLAAETVPAAADFALSRPVSRTTVIASSHRPVGRPPCMKEPEFRRILRPVGQLFLVGEAKQSPNAGDTLPAANLLHPVRIDTGRNEPRAIPTQLAAIPPPPPLADARSHAATAMPRRTRDGPRTNFNRRRSS
jgi:hypothetical protein